MLKNVAYRTIRYMCIILRVGSHVDFVLIHCTDVRINCTVGWLVGFVALRPKSTAMVIAGRSVHLTTLFPGQA